MKQGESPVYLVFRNFTGNTLFNGLINKKIGKFKDIINENKPNDYKLKVAVLCKEFGGKNYLPEHVEIKFNTDMDKQNFKDVFK